MAKKDTKQEKKLTVPEIIAHLRDDLGITFNYMDEKEAENFLSQHNYYFRLKQYADNFEQKAKTGKYIGLDFGHLVELSTIDMYFRKIILKMTIDFEHYLKVKLVQDCQTNPQDDGYQVVAEFLNQNPKIQEAITSTAYLASYSANRVKEHLYHLAVWNITELLSFHHLTHFVEYYYKYFSFGSNRKKNFEPIRRLRNVAAHNIGMLCSFKPSPGFKFDTDLCFMLIQSPGALSPNAISSAIKVPVLNDFASLLEVYGTTITSQKIKEKTMGELKEFFEGRMVRHKDWFQPCSEINNAYKFALWLIERYSLT